MNLTCVYVSYVCVGMNVVYDDHVLSVMILRHRRDVWTVFGIECEHLDYKSFLTTCLGHPHSVSSVSDVPVCNTGDDSVTGGEVPGLKKEFPSRIALSTRLSFNKMSLLSKKILRSSELRL